MCEPPQQGALVGGVRIEGARPAFEMCFKFVAPLVHDRHSRDGGGIAERAEGATKHVLRQVLDVINVLFHTRAIVEAGKGFLEPVCTLAAGNAPSAALVLVKLHDAEREFDHACSLIED